MKRYIPILALFLFPSVLFSQKQDTVKHKIVKEWHLSKDFTEEIEVPFDTTFSLFHRYRIADKNSPFNATLGNYGLPFYQIDFFDRNEDPDKFLYWYFYPFIWQPERYIFMNTQVPFTELLWTYGSPRETAEQTFRVRHSQNINRYFNFGLIFDINYSLGQYEYQQSTDKDFTFYSSYTKEKYKFYFAAAINNLTENENGGIKDLAQLKELKPSEVAVNLGNLNKSQSLLKNRNIMFVQKYTIGAGSTTSKDTAKTEGSKPFRMSGTFSHIFVYDVNKRTYSDNSPTSGFYDTTYISRIKPVDSLNQKSTTFDSLYQRSFQNTLRFDFTTDPGRKFRLGGGFGIRNELFRYSQIIPTHDTVHVADTAIWRRNNNAVIGRLFNNIGNKFNWEVTGELYLTGFKAGDFNLTGVITKIFDWKKGRALWNITGAIHNRQPSFWQNQWGSNNFEWQNSLSKEFRIDVGTRFAYPGRNAELRFNYAVIKNYVDFDTIALPDQHAGGLSIASIYLRKDLRAWKFHLATDVLIQKSSNKDVLDLPLLSARSAGYFEHMFLFRHTNGRLNTQLGIDVSYNTPYHPYAFMPATGRFYRQYSFTSGDYPYVNVFLNIKLKRTRIFLMLDHVNSGYSGYNYLQVPHYPMNVRMFRYGIAWTFYD
jgi:hypothetical protein